MYGQPGVHDINEARYRGFCETKLQQCLPPTKNALAQHIKRCNYQAAIYKYALLPFIDAPSPMSHGWQLKDGKIGVTWMTQEPCPEVTLMSVYCSCKTGCTSGRCSCNTSKLQCTDLCKCSNCNNNAAVIIESDPDDPDSEIDCEED